METKELTDIEIVADLWKRRVAWLWDQCELTSGQPLDISKLDDMIIADEKAHDEAVRYGKERTEWLMRNKK